MTDRELFKMALAALEECYDVQSYPADGTTPQDKAIEALRARLAQPEQEPFEYWNAVEGWVKIEEVRQHFDTAGCGTIYKTGGEDRVPLYAAPPKKEWVGLTDAEVEKVFFDMGQFAKIDLKTFARAIEAKLKEKNT